MDAIPGAHLFWESFSPEEWIPFEETIMERMQHHLDLSIGNMSFESFHTDFLDDLADEFQDEWTEMGLFSKEEVEEGDEEKQIIMEATIRQEIFDLLESYAHSFFLCVDVPVRYSPHIVKAPQDTNIETDLFTKIKLMQNAPQPEQRSKEWYESRNQMITASNVWKIFGSEAEHNQLIFEKCQAKRERSSSLTDGQEESEFTFVNTSSPMHWGVKYEPVTIMLYEAMNQVCVGAFGCIVHPEHKYIGASPDGIVVAPETSPLYGRMVEIKNIVNREITGSPSEAYWIQMQMQMETCDLDICDFVETRFKEYTDETEFFASLHIPEKGAHDKETEAEIEDSRKLWRGIILYFLKSGFGPHYRYMPFDISLHCREAVESWISTTKEEEYASGKWILYETHYWYLDEYSCVTVERNRQWAKWAIPHISDTWNTIEKERVEGYEHRAAKKRNGGNGGLGDGFDSSNIQVIHSPESTSQYIRNFPPTQNICLIKLDENGNVLRY